jgi:hypothetical protein
MSLAPEETAHRVLALTLVTLPVTSSLVERGKKADGPTPELIFGLRDPLPHLENESIVLSFTALLLINTLGSATLLWILGKISFIQ